MQKPLAISTFNNRVTQSGPLVSQGSVATVLIIERNYSLTHLKCSTNAIDKELPTVLLGVVKTLSLYFRSHRIDNVFHVVVRKEIWNLSRGQQVVDKHQETFISNLIHTCATRKILVTTKPLTIKPNIHTV